MLRLLIALVLCTSTPAALAAAPAPDPATRFAELTQAAEAAYAARDFEGAIARYLDAYAIIASPDLLYNVGFIFEADLRKRERARGFYERIVRDPSARPELVRLASDRLAVLDAADAAEAARPTILKTQPEPIAPPDPTLGQRLQPSEGPGPGPWILVGTGGALLLGGIISGLVALDAEAAHEDIALVDADALERARGEADRGETAATVSDVLLVSGGLAAVTGIVWLVAGGDDHRASGPAARLGPVRGGFAAELSLSF